MFSTTRISVLSLFMIMPNIMHRLSALLTFLLLLSTVVGSPHTSANHELLSRLGMTRRRAPSANHHRKRVVGESRHHTANNGDSHMFVIKLPPNPYYYSHIKPQTLNPNEVSKLPLSFRANGKPARVYHWNLPVMNKMARRRKTAQKLQDSKIYNIQKTSPWVAESRSHIGNDVLQAKEHNHHNHHEKVSFYGPAFPRKHLFQKYFPGNGKPASFYVIEKNKKHHHRLLKP